MGWHRFTVELLKLLGDDPHANPIETLASTCQVGTVDEYIHLFLFKMAIAPPLSDLKPSDYSSMVSRRTSVFAFALEMRRTLVQPCTLHEKSNEN